MRLHIKLQRTSTALRKWARALIGRNKLLLKAASQLIGILEVVQEFRPLNEQEVALKRDHKMRFLGLTAVERLRAKQAARINYISATEANTKLFYLLANGRRRKNAIHSLQDDNGIHYTEEDKASLLFNHFSKHFGDMPAREYTLNWEQLGLTRHELQHLEEPFTEEEVIAVIHDVPPEKARGRMDMLGCS